ncbi:MAG: sulfite reductase subunit A [Hyphomicrobiales bacterium]|nr:MAG: sulfite reductase subunit A [Hyphomicrobiales bacterium]
MHMGSLLYRLDADGPDRLLRLLQQLGFSVVAPRSEDGAIVLATYETGEKLPRGLSDRQAGGHYRLVERGDGKLFDYTLGPQGFKRFLWPPHQVLWTAEKTEDGFVVTEPPLDTTRLALFAARACELDALSALDDVFDNGDYADPAYKARRENAFVVAVECTRSGDTCFCSSMNSGPGAEEGYDIALTEIFEDGAHWFLARAGSEEGAEVLTRLSPEPAPGDGESRRKTILAAVASSQQRTMRSDAEPLLKANREHPHWDDVAARCLACGNCTSVCPTCFCTTTVDHTDLTATKASRERRWDFCFTVDYSYIHGGAIRRSAKARYRQWMMHKLAFWHDQFDRSGCVGCGRCITWCPVGIDIVEETAAIAAASEGGNNG